MEKAKVPAARWVHIIIPSILVYIVSNIDRNNVSFAIAGGMSKALNMSPSISGLVAGVFFFGYLFLQIPGGKLADHGNAKKLIFFTILGWGGIAFLTGFAQNVTQLLILRFILGFFEGALWPVVLTIISHWFPSEERGRANGYFLMNSAIAAVVGGPISGFFLNYFNWRVMFFAEGILSLLMTVIWMPLIADRPENAKWLSKEERAYLEEKFAEDAACQKAKVAQKGPVKHMFANSITVRLVVFYLAYSAGTYGFSIWLPTIIKELTHTGIGIVGLLSALPYVGSIIGILIVSKFSDRSGNRKFYTAMPLFMFCVCLIFSVLLKKQIWLSYLALIGCGVFVHTVSGNFWTIPPLAFGADNAGGVRGIINALGGLGGFLGPYLVGYMKTISGTNLGVYTLVAICMVGFFVLLSLPSSITTDCKTCPVPAKRPVPEHTGSAS